MQHTILLRHHRYPNMYVQPLACSPSSGALTCPGALVAIPITASILLIIKQVVIPRQDAKL